MITFKEFLALEMPWHPAVVKDLDPAFYNDKDVKLIQGLKTGGKNLKLTQKLMKPKSYSIYPVYTSNQNTDEEIRELVKQQHGEIDWKNSIVFVKIRSSGDPLRGWMNIHTFGHAVWREFTDGIYWKRIENILNNLATELEHKHDPYKTMRRNEQESLLRLCAFIDIGSCRNLIAGNAKSVILIEELIYELTAQIARGASIMPNFNLPSAKNLTEEQKTIATESMKEIEEIMINKLNSLKGKIIWDI